MEDDDYKLALTQSYQLLGLAAAMALDSHVLDEAIDWAKHAEAVGWAIDPTAYRDKADKLRQDIEVMVKVRDFMAYAEKIKAAVLPSA